MIRNGKVNLILVSRNLIDLGTERARALGVGERMISIVNLKRVRVIPMTKKEDL